jgi:hypothetical protein
MVFLLLYTLILPLPKVNSITYKVFIDRSLKIAPHEAYRSSSWLLEREMLYVFKFLQKKPYQDDVKLILWYL